MREEWLAILLTSFVLLTSLGVLLRIILKALRRKGEPLPTLPDRVVLLPLGAAFPGNDRAAVDEALALLPTGSKLVLALPYEVPRATALEKATPPAEEVALLESLRQGWTSTESVILPCRSALEEVLKLAVSQQASAIFVRVLPNAESDPGAVLLQRAPCAVYLSHSPQ